MGCGRIIRCLTNQLFCVIVLTEVAEVDGQTGTRLTLMRTLLSFITERKRQSRALDLEAHQQLM